MKKIAAACRRCRRHCCVSVVATAGAKNHAPSGAAAAVVPPINYGVADDTGKYSDDGGAWFDGMLARREPHRGALDARVRSEQPDGDHRAPVPAARGAEGAGGTASTSSSRSTRRPASCARPDGVLRVGGDGREHGEGVGHPRLHRLERAEHGAVLVAAGSRRRRRPRTRRCSRPATTRSTPPTRARASSASASPRGSNGPTQTAPIPFIARVGSGVQGLRADDADHGSDVDPPVPESEQPDRLAGRRLRERPNSYGVPNLDRVKQAIYDALQRHRAADDAERPHVPHRRARLADRHDAVPAVLSTRRTSRSSASRRRRTTSSQAVQKYLACDPTVTDVEWFLLVDEATRNGKDADREDDRRRLAERSADRGRPGRVDAEARVRAGRAALRGRAARRAPAGMVSWLPTRTVGGTKGGTTPTVTTAHHEPEDAADMREGPEVHEGTSLPEAAVERAA